MIALGGLATAAALCLSSPTTRLCGDWGRAAPEEVGRSRASMAVSGLLGASERQRVFAFLFR